jgi:hypothetical protein
LSHTILLIEDLKKRAYFGIILILMLLMIVMYFGDKYNWLSMRDNCVSSKCRWTKTQFLLAPLIYKVQRCWFSPNKPNRLKEKCDLRRRKAQELREVVLENDVDGNDVLKITIKTSRLGGQADNSKQDWSSVQQKTQGRPVRPVQL